jgi:hypothetical protein
MKHTLRTSNRCSHVIMASDQAMSYWGEVDRRLVPRFILSQLELQRLTNNSLAPVSLSPLLAFLLDALLPPGSGIKGHPTKFTWYDRLAHKTLHVYANIVLEMVSGKYTVKELFSIRGHPLPDMMSRLKAVDHDLGSLPSISSVLWFLLCTFASRSDRITLAAILNGPMPRVSRSDRHNAHENNDRHPDRAIEASSSSVDDVILKDNFKRRAVSRKVHRDIHEEVSRDSSREPAQELSQNSHREANHEGPRDAGEESVRSTVATLATKASDSRQAREVSETEVPATLEWKYRGRGDLEAKAKGVLPDEPIPAPTGSRAQKSEGFQRFYKAVVSPTHVRVTAGGRIVPNLRGPPSPTSKRSTKDTLPLDGLGVADNTNSSKQAHTPITMVMGQPLPALMPHMLPGFRPGQQQLYPGLPFIPMAFGSQFPGGYAFPPAMGTVPLSQHATTMDTALKETQNVKEGEQHGETGVGADKGDKVKVSSPEQFDGSKPFWFNGQVMYPYPPAAFAPPMANPFLPFPMVGMPPGFTGPIMPTALPNGNGPSPMMSMMPAIVPSPQPLPGFAPAANKNQAMNMTAPAPHLIAQTAPHSSSIRLSEITKKQIVTFHQRLKYFEDQLQYNRHQIDEKMMEENIQAVRNNIKEFNSKLKTQLAEEARMYGEEETSKAKPSMEAANVLSSPAIPEPSVEDKEKVQKALVAGSLAEKAHEKQWGALSTGVVGASGKAYDFSPPLRASSPSFVGSSRSFGLSSAALAPVFQPRGHTASMVEPDLGQSTDDEVQGRIPGATRKPVSASLDERRIPGTFNKSFSISASHKSADMMSSLASVPKDQKYCVPYLLGTLPAGVDPRTAQDTDYTYIRPLTDDELRARFLYWGKAPKVARQGLPKYDGRHFYPPSPVKGHAGGSSSDSTTRYTAQESHALVDEDLDDDMDPFHSLPLGSNRTISLQHASSFQTQVGVTASESTEKTDSGDEMVESTAATASRQDSVDTASVSSADRRVVHARYAVLDAFVRRNAK